MLGVATILAAVSTSPLPILPVQSFAVGRLSNNRYGAHEANKVIQRTIIQARRTLFIMLPQGYGLAVILHLAA